MRKVFSVSMLIVGTMIGAGFCTGREIVSFFGTRISIFAAPICGICMFAACALFLTIASSVRARSFEQVHCVVLGKAHRAADCLLVVNNFIVLSAMMAGCNSLFSPLCRIPVFGVAAAVLCAVIAAKGKQGLLGCNALVVPIIIVVLASAVSCGFREGEVALSVGNFAVRTPLAAVLYISMNMMLASSVLTTIGALSRREILCASLLASAIITALLAGIIASINCTGNYGAEMPVLEIARRVSAPLGACLTAVVGISIFTTMLTAVGGLFDFWQDKFGGVWLTRATVLFVGAVLSMLGFTRVVSLFYPLVGVFGLLYFCACTRFTRAGRKAKRGIRKAKRGVRKVKRNVRAK